MGRLLLHCLYTFLQGIKEIIVGDLGVDWIEEIGLTVQNFDKLGFDLWWVYKELEAAKIMRENKQLWRHCEGAKVALKEARAALAKAQSAVVVAEALWKSEGRSTSAWLRRLVLARGLLTSLFVILTLL
ncbi:hypothetical protein RHGRI_030962 [Rhododendron griersonianum]|uniref:Uncharacterized protein n=1 Tax=Rhododendron griersonianum TaxID=479676 RepID=A0AAV6I8H4_9ERIC|nr:hypothetical protein RHGRI_030962 [Rhododendron griersonianum]